MPTSAVFGTVQDDITNAFCNFRSSLEAISILETGKEVIAGNKKCFQQLRLLTASKQFLICHLET